MSVLIKDDGFHPSPEIHYDESKNIWIEPEQWPELLKEESETKINLSQAELITIHFKSFADGRGFSIARELREKGYQGKIRAAGHIIADQYTMARRTGFDEVEISDELAARQDEPQWLARANWKAFDYQARIGQEIGAQK